MNNTSSTHEPIDREKIIGDNAIPAWEVNLHRALNSYTDRLDQPVQKVWVTSITTYSSDPADKSQYAGGSRSRGPVYATENDAWEVLALEFEKWAAKKREAIARRGVVLPDKPKERTTKRSKP